MAIRAMKKKKLMSRCAAWWLTFGILSWCCLPAYSQTPTVDPVSTSSPVPVGSGARAQGMGGAFIAVADDATAASWNPGGLGQLRKPELSVVGGYFSHTECYDAEDQGRSRNSSSDLNYFSFAYAKNIWQRNMFFSLNYQKLFDMSRRAKFDFPSNPPYDTPNKIDFQQEGSLYTLSPAFSIEICPGLYTGVTRNIWSDNITKKSRWKSENQYTTPRLPFDKILQTTSDYTDFQGDNWTLGFLWKITRQLQLGGVYKTPFTARVKNELRQMYIQGSDQTPYPAKETVYRIDFPEAYGVGLSYKFGNSLILAGDITRTEWQDYIIYDPSGAEVGPFAPPIGKIPEKDSTYTVRLGAEYAFILDKPKIIVPVRCGVFYDPEPSVDDRSQNFYGLSFGFGIGDERLALDFAYQFRKGTQVNPYGLDLSDISDKGDVRQHYFLSSLIVYY